MRLLWLICQRSPFSIPVIFTFMIGFMIGIIAATLRSYSEDYCWFNCKSLEFFDEIDTQHRNDTFHLLENRTVADKLKQTVRVLCIVMTVPEHHQTRARHIKVTWGKRCNKLIFMSTQQNDALPTVALPVISDDPLYQWRKAKEAFKYVYSSHFHEADWFVKVNDDTFVVIENLRYMLKSYNPDNPVYFGCKITENVNKSYMSSDAGYVLSREALKRFVEKGLTNNTLCREDDTGAEDNEMAFCLQALNIEAGDSKDSADRGRFFPFDLKHLFDHIYYEHEQSMGCCADSIISFHFHWSYELYILEYFIYHVRPYGISLTSEDDDLNLKTHSSQIIGL